MRMLLDVTIPHEPFNTAVRNGTAGATISRILEDIKPEATVCKPCGRDFPPPE